MEFNQLIDEFAKRHNVENLVAVDGAASLDIDGFIVTIVANEGMLILSAEIGEPPAEGAATFANLLLEANLQSGVFFAKAVGSGPYLAVQRTSLSLLDEDAFDKMLEAFVNQTETWSRLLTDFRPVAKAAAEKVGDAPLFGTNGFVKV